MTVVPLPVPVPVLRTLPDCCHCYLWKKGSVDSPVSYRSSRSSFVADSPEPPVLTDWCQDSVDVYVTDTPPASCASEKEQVSQRQRPKNMASPPRYHQDLTPQPQKLCSYSPVDCYSRCIRGDGRLSSTCRLQVVFAGRPAYVCRGRPVGGRETLGRSAG